MQQTLKPEAGFLKGKHVNVLQVRLALEKGNGACVSQGIRVCVGNATAALEPIGFMLSGSTQGEDVVGGNADRH